MSDFTSVAFWFHRVVHAPCFEGFSSVYHPASTLKCLSFLVQGESLHNVEHINLGCLSCLFLESPCLILRQKKGTDELKQKVQDLTEEAFSASLESKGWKQAACDAQAKAREAQEMLDRTSKVWQGAERRFLDYPFLCVLPWILYRHRRSGLWWRTE